MTVGVHAESDEVRPLRRDRAGPRELDLANLVIRGSREQGGPQRTEPVHQGIEPLLEERDNARGEASTPLPRLEE